MYVCILTSVPVEIITAFGTANRLPHIQRLSTLLRHGQAKCTSKVSCFSKVNFYQRLAYVR